MYYIFVIMKTMCSPVIMTTHTLGNTNESYFMSISTRVAIQSYI